MATLKCWCCGEPGVELSGFMVPDKVWDALFPLDVHVCASCFATKLNPDNPPDREHLEEEIRRQRKRFNLRAVNKWLGDKTIGEQLRGRYIAYFEADAEATAYCAELAEEELKRMCTSRRAKVIKLKK
jgi:hypothetical protein